LSGPPPYIYKEHMKKYEQNLDRSAHTVVSEDIPRHLWWPATWHIRVSGTIPMYVESWFLYTDYFNDIDIYLDDCRNAKYDVAVASERSFKMILWNRRSRRELRLKCADDKARGCLYYF